MGDMGLGFLYARQDLLPRLHRTLYGYRQLADYQQHIFPWETPGPYPVEYRSLETAAGYFEIGTFANAVIAALSFSLPWLRALGVERIQAHAQTLCARLRQQLPALGYPCLTPESSHAPIVAFGIKNLERTTAQLARARIDVSLGKGRMRISPSVYNTVEDVDRLLHALDAQG
jgi:selenocysteine lyase/cysteine desulfurase